MIFFNLIYNLNTYPAVRFPRSPTHTRTLAITMSNTVDLQVLVNALASFYKAEKYQATLSELKRLALTRTGYMVPICPYGCNCSSLEAKRNCPLSHCPSSGNAPL